MEYPNYFIMCLIIVLSIVLIIIFTSFANMECFSSLKYKYLL